MVPGSLLWIIICGKPVNLNCYCHWLNFDCVVVQTTDRSSLSELLLNTLWVTNWDHNHKSPSRANCCEPPGQISVNWLIEPFLFVTLSLTQKQTHYCCTWAEVLECMFSFLSKMVTLLQFLEENRSHLYRGYGNDSVVECNCGGKFMEVVWWGIRLHFAYWQIKTVLLIKQHLSVQVIHKPFKQFTLFGDL